MREIHLGIRLRWGRVRGIAMVALALSFIGCASSQFATYRPPGSTKEAWEIEAKWHSLGDQLSILINGTIVLDTGVNIFSGKGDAEGTYEDKKIKAVVYKSGELFEEKTIVQIFVDGVKAAEFKF